MDTTQGSSDRIDKEKKSRGPEGIYKEGASAQKLELDFGGVRKGFWTRRKASTICKWI